MFPRVATPSVYAVKNATRQRVSNFLFIRAPFLNTCIHLPRQGFQTPEYPIEKYGSPDTQSEA
jgi:hypothetical protein